MTQQGDRNSGRCVVLPFLQVSRTGHNSRYIPPSLPSTRVVIGPNNAPGKKTSTRLKDSFASPVSPPADPSMATSAWKPKTIAVGGGRQPQQRERTTMRNVTKTPTAAESAPHNKAANGIDDDGDNSHAPAPTGSARANQNNEALMKNSHQISPGAPDILYRTNFVKALFSRKTAWFLTSIAALCLLLFLLRDEFHGPKPSESSKTQPQVQSNLNSQSSRRSFQPPQVSGVRGR